MFIPSSAASCHLFFTPRKSTYLASTRPLTISDISTIQFRPASGSFVILLILMANNQPNLAKELRCKPKQPNLIEAGPNSLVEMASSRGER